MHCRILFDVFLVFIDFFMTEKKKEKVLLKSSIVLIIFSCRQMTDSLSKEEGLLLNDLIQYHLEQKCTYLPSPIYKDLDI